MKQPYFAIIAIFIFLGCATQPPVILEESKPGEASSNQQPIYPIEVSKPDEGAPSTGKAATKAQKALVRPNNGIPLDHRYFQISYNADHRLANYVQYSLTKADVENSRFERRNNFHSDDMLERAGFEPVKKQDYTNSGYDRGHLAPAEDFSYSREGQDETFVMSNMVPQKGKLNQQAWKYLEERVRRWACGEEKIQVITGPILESRLPKLKRTISIPKQFFKAVLDETPPKKTVCFIYNQTDSKDVYKERAMTVQACESAIGFSLFADLAKTERDQLVKGFDLGKWVEKKCEQAN